MTSATVMWACRLSSSMSRRASTSGKSPIDVALTTMSAASGIRNVLLHGTNVALAGVCSRSRLTSSCPRRPSRLTTMTEAAPASATSTEIARAAPPAPNTTTAWPLGSTLVRNDERKPWPSVFSPVSPFSRFTTQFTAPMICADGARSSRYDRTVCLWGIEQFESRPSHRSGTADGVAKGFGPNIAVDVARIDAVMPVGGLHYRDCRVLCGWCRERAGKKAEEAPGLWHVFS